MQQLGIVVPTNNPSEYFAVMHPTVEALRPMMEHVAVHVLFNFQPPWTLPLIERVVRDFATRGMSMRYVFSKPTGEIARMCDLRHVAAALLPDADWWMYADDNMRFAVEGTPQYPEGSAARYLHVIDYLNAFPRCGVVMCVGSLGGSAWRYSIRPTRNGLVATARGLFLRNITNGVLYTPEERALIGGMEETMPAFRLLSRGYFFAKQFNNPTYHPPHYRFGDVVPENHMANYQRVIKPNAERYVREVYRDPEWTHEGRYIPAHAWALYQEAGGHTEIFGKQPTCWKDYAPTR